MHTRIVEREDVKVLPSLNAIHGPKGFLGNQELGGGLQFCIIEEVTEEVIAVTGDHAHACISQGDQPMGTVTARIALGYVCLQEVDDGREDIRVHREGREARGGEGILISTGLTFTLTGIRQMVAYEEAECVCPSEEVRRNPSPADPDLPDPGVRMGTEREHNPLGGV